MSEQPWETHDRLCSSRRPSVAYPRKACPECRTIDAARAETLDRVRDEILAQRWMPYHCVDCIDNDDVTEAFAELRGEPNGP